MALIETKSFQTKANSTAKTVTHLGQRVPKKSPAPKAQHAVLKQL